MSNVLEAAKQLAEMRADAQARQKSELLIKARAMAKAIVTGTDSPAPEDVIELCDALRVDVEWFNDAVSRCEKRLADVQGLERVPGLKDEAERLEALALSLATEADIAKAACEYAALQVKNVDGMTFSPWRHDVTSAELKTRRDAIARWGEFADGHWLAARDAAAIRKEIAQLGKIDLDNIDPASPEPSPWDFVLPPV